MALLVLPICAVTINLPSAHETVIIDFFSTLSNHTLTNTAQYLSYEDREEFTDFITNSNNIQHNIGFFNYSSVTIVSLSSLPAESIDMSIVDTDKAASYSNWQCWDCIVDVVAYRETSYLSSGYNQFHIYTAEDDAGNALIGEICRLGMYSPDSVVSPLSYDAPVSAPARGAWENPSTINVRNYGNVNFKDYCYVVTANEFGTNSYNTEARKAVAMTVKQYGWNRTLVQKYSNYEYDVKETTADQVYNPNKTVSSKVEAAVDSIWNYAMLTCDFKLFCSFHVASSSINSHAVYHGGILSQTQANTLGTNGNSWQDILHYFYDYGTYNSEMTQGVISIIGLNHDPDGDPFLDMSDSYYHAFDCRICGCIHGQEVHTWSLTGSKYICTECGFTTTSPPSAIVSLEEDFEHE